MLKKEYFLDVELFRSVAFENLKKMKIGINFLVTKMQN